MKRLLAILFTLFPLVAYAQPIGGGLIGGGSGSASAIQGRAVAPTAPADTNVLCWDAAASTWKPCAAGTATSVATDTIWDAAGDLVQGTGANTSARLPIGTAGQIPMINAAGTLLEYTLPIPIVAAAGTVDVITANYSPDITLSSMRIVAFVASGANTSTTPTFAPDGLTARTIVRHGGQALAVGDIPAALAVCLLQYNLANTRWELLNPAQPPASLTGTFTFSNGATPGSIYFQEGSGDGTHTMQLIGRAAITGNMVSTLPISTNYLQGTVAEGATTEILVGGGASTLPIWTTATGTGAPVRAGSPTFTGTPVLSTSTATSLLATGIVDGTAPIVSTVTSAGYTLGATYKSGYTWTNPGTAAADFIMTLPTAFEGAQYCAFNGPAKTGKLTVYTALSPTGTQYIDLDGVLTANTGGIQATAVAGNFACFVGLSTTHWKSIPTKGTWTKVTR